MTDQEVLDQAQASRRRGNLVEAITLLRSQLPYFPSHAAILGLLGVILLESGDRTEAVSLLQISAGLSTKPETLNNLAIAHLLKGELQESLRIASRGLLLAPHDLKLRETLAAIEDHIKESISEGNTTQASSVRTNKFSIIVPHYDGSISDEILLRGLRSLAAQTYEYFEVLLYHDGPLSRPLPDMSEFRFPLRITVTETRHNNWGHSQRDMGIRAASGEYIVHFNPDNILYPNALAEIAAMTIPTGFPILRIPDGRYWTTNNNIVIFPIYLMEVVLNGWGITRLQGTGSSHRMVLSGYPVQRYMIDAMQLVMKRSLWLDHGGWSDKRVDSDGILYPTFVQKNGGARFCSQILGEHW